ncbi:NAD-dependent epimerase/dehydratase family protein [Legionella sp. CNM-4043-24]|uniref:NAD-dependent epimerase/dehydratase family protein n=1 Tax=Legionella sp. CNM-4043-24 TaxID=3421646 RepID=UPI00403AA04E
MTIVITGANGFLGRHLVSVFQQENTPVVELVRTTDGNKAACDLADKEQVTERFKSLSPDLLIHCAAFVPQSLADYQKAELSLNNTRMLDNLLSATDCPIIYISSMTVYGESTKLSRSEPDAGNPSSEYGRSKYEGELLLRQSGRDSLAVRIPGLFGGNRQSGLIANLIHSLRDGKTPSLPDKPIIWAAMDVMDAARIIYELSQTTFTGFNPVNVAYPDVYSINRLLSYCNEHFKTEFNCAIAHPEFAFDLASLESRGVKPDNDLRRALNNYMAAIL